ncbi:MAG: nucleotidyltransferase domain-containing protein [Xenococcus sp. (in: cyanobacteria)]
MNKQKIENIINLLNDEKWHSAQELTECFSSHFVDQIYQARQEGYCIETRKVNKNQYKYRIDKQKISIEHLRQLVQNNHQAISHLKLLILFGSRVSDNIHAKSDWDFAVIYDSDKLNIEPKNDKISVFQTSQIIGELLKINSDTIDIVDLDQCSALLAHFIARDGEIIYEQQPGAFEKFRQKSLLSNSQLQEIENNLQNQINSFLKDWVSK